MNLSHQETLLLGTKPVLKNGQDALYRYPSFEEWPRVRDLLLKRSLLSNPNLDSNLTAYTPGETKELLDNSVIRAWHAQVSNFKVPSSCQIIAFVPCAKTKPWRTPKFNRSVLYRAYNALALEYPSIYFVTVSEPLGIVPYEYWNNFPQYDNPGLFVDDTLRSGMTTKQWHELYGEKLIIPFDKVAFRHCIDKLSIPISQFMTNNPNFKYLSFVENTSPPVSTHSLMLKSASALSKIPIESFHKKPIAHSSPYPYIKSIFIRELSSPTRFRTQELDPR